MSKILSSLTIAVFVVGAGCAKTPDKIEASYVSPETYSGLTCNQIISQRNTVVTQVNKLSITQSRKASNDQVAVGVGAVLFFPALLALTAGSDLEPQIAQLKGNYDALTEAGEKKNCF